MGFDFQQKHVSLVNHVQTGSGTPPASPGEKYSG